MYVDMYRGNGEQEEEFFTCFYDEKCVYMKLRATNEMNMERKRVREKE